MLRKQVTKGMAIWVVKFPREGFKIDRVLAENQKTSYLLYFADRAVVPRCQNVNISNFVSLFLET